MLCGSCQLGFSKTGQPLQLSVNLLDDVSPDRDGRSRRRGGAIGHHSGLPWFELPAFMIELIKHDELTSLERIVDSP